MPPELDILKLVTSALDEAAIPYMLTGSMAAGYYAEPRMTRDADLVVELSEADLDHMQKWAAYLGVTGLLEEVRTS